MLEEMTVLQTPRNEQETNDTHLSQAHPVDGNMEVANADEQPEIHDT